MNFRACFWSSRVLPRVCMEAAGIEPASRNHSIKASTCIVDCLIFALTTPVDRVRFRLSENFV